MVVLVNEIPSAIRSGMWFKDRSGKRWRWRAYGDAGVLTDGAGRILLLAWGCHILWRLDELESFIARGEVTPESNSATVEIGTLAANTVVKWSNHFWQIQQIHGIGKPMVIDSVTIRIWPYLIADEASVADLPASTQVIPIGMPVIVDEKEKE